MTMKSQAKSICVGHGNKKSQRSIKWTNKDNMVLHSGNNLIGILHMHMYSKLLEHLPTKQITPATDLAIQIRVCSYRLKSSI